MEVVVLSRKASNGKFNFSKIKLFVLLGVLIYASITFFNQQSMLTAQNLQQAALLQQEQELTQQIEYYQNELNYIGSDEYIEKQARERLGWLKEGEEKYVEVPPDATVPAAAPTPVVTETTPPSTAPSSTDAPPTDAPQTEAPPTTPTANATASKAPMQTPTP